MKLATGLAACLVLMATASPAGAADPAPLEIRAQLTPRRLTTLSAELATRIGHLSLREGERFREGQLLVGMECSLQRANLDKARASLAAATKTSAVNARLHDMNAGGALEAEVAEAEAAKARADVGAASAVVSKCQITAPFSGRVSEVKVHEQQFVQPGTVMLEIIDDSALEVEFLAPSRWVTWLKPGVAFQVVIHETGKTYPAHVARLGARVDPVSQSVKVVGEISGTSPELLAGMSGRVLVSPKE